jgi:uncharacterized membrane protein YhhN
VGGVRHLAFLLLKPLPVLAALAWVVRARPLPSARYRGLLIAGLALGACGDVLLELPGLFLGGLVAFLLGHLCYGLAFAAEGARPRPASLAGPMLVALGVVASLWSALGGLRLPVLCYVGAIGLMAGLALDRYRRDRAAPSLRAALGAGAFLVSDAVLAWAKFREGRPPAFAGVVILGTYYVAQCLLASSVGHSAADAAGQETRAPGR